MWFDIYNQKYYFRDSLYIFLSLHTTRKQWAFLCDKPFRILQSTDVLGDPSWRGPVPARIWSNLSSSHTQSGESPAPWPASCWSSGAPAGCWSGDCSASSTSSRGLSAPTCSHCQYPALPADPPRHRTPPQSPECRCRHLWAGRCHQGTQTCCWWPGSLLTTGLLLNVFQVRK